MRSPLRDIPGGNDVFRIRTDPAHTFAIQGFGSTLASSAVILLSIIMLFPGRSTQLRLNRLYSSFIMWCRVNSKSTSIDRFSLLKFKMKTLPASSSTDSICVGCEAIFRLCSGPTCEGVELRLRNFPSGAGKGFDTILLCCWLDDLLKEGEQSERVVSGSTCSHFGSCTLYMLVSE